MGDTPNELPDLNDLHKQMLQRLQKVRQQVTEETGKMASNLGVPAGLNLPGLG